MNTVYLDMQQTATAIMVIITNVSNETRSWVHENYMVPGSHTNSNLCVIGEGNTTHQQSG